MKKDVIHSCGYCGTTIRLGQSHTLGMLYPDKNGDFAIPHAVIWISGKPVLMTARLPKWVLSFGALDDIRRN